MFRYALALCFGVIASAYAGEVLNDEQRNTLFMSVRATADKCMEEFKVTEEDMRAAHKSGNLDPIDPCFMACNFKGRGLINKDGKFDKDAAFKFFEQFVKSDEKKEQIKNLAEICSAVNDEEVSDGVKGCERAKLLMGCIMEYNKNA